MTIAQAANLALQHVQTGRLAEAETLYRQILATQPRHAEALHILGVIAHQTGRHELAVKLISFAISIEPLMAQAHCNLGTALQSLGLVEEAIAAHFKAIRLQPYLADAHFNLGNALRDHGQIGAAEAAYRSVLALKPRDYETRNSLGDVLRCQGRLDDAAAECRSALALKPDYAEAHNNLGAVLADQGQLDEAVAACRRALELKPNLPEAHSNLGQALKDQGGFEEAVAAFRRALAIRPEFSMAHSNLIYALHFHPGYDARKISEERERWNRQFSNPLKRFILPHANDRNPERRLRIGYVSSDFRFHVVGRYMLPLFERHDRGQFELLCYSGVARPDWMTERFRALASRWRNTVGVSDAKLAETIRDDEVDILVDLTQHMAGNRLPLFARKPAPVQVSFAGYPGSTGLEAIEYRISDRYLEAGSADEKTAGSEQIHLIDSFWCYDPCGMELEVGPLPALESGAVIFGCLNNFCKVNEPLLSLWARVLGKVKDSRLILSSHDGGHRQRTLETLDREGIVASRVAFVDFRPLRDYLELYHRLDIALDTYPYNGGMTTCDALWMGIPVVSLAGETPVSRLGLSLLTNLGLPEWVARSKEHYVSIAAELAGDIPRLTQLRSTLRHRMENSVLMNAPLFTRMVEAAYRSMWRRCCIGHSPDRG